MGVDSILLLQFLRPHLVSSILGLVSSTEDICALNLNAITAKQLASTISPKNNQVFFPLNILSYPCYAFYNSLGGKFGPIISEGFEGGVVLQ